MIGPPKAALSTLSPSAPQSQVATGQQEFELALTRFAEDSHTELMQPAGVFVHLTSHAFVPFFAAQPFDNPTDHLALRRCIKRQPKSRLSHMPVGTDAMTQLVLEREAEDFLLIGRESLVEFTDSCLCGMLCKRGGKQSGTETPTGECSQRRSRRDGFHE